MMKHRKAFTLVEVCLAVGVVAVGVLSMCGLYTLGFRECQQGEEDVVGILFADQTLAPIAAALSKQSMKWSDWCKIGDTGVLDDSVADAVWPATGWREYVEVSGDGKCRVKQNCNSIAENALVKLKSRLPDDAKVPCTIPSVGRFSYACVITRKGACIQLAFRVARRTEYLFSQPLSVMEVRYQGDPEK